MALIINSSNVKQLIRGASLFTTGGGVPISDQEMTVKKLKKFSLKIKSLNDFPKDGYICTAAELGPTDVAPLKKDHLVSPMLDLLSKTTGKKIVGIYPPEIGQESVVIESASLLKLPLVDFDPAGFRAVPFIDINVFNLKKMAFSYTPMAVADDFGEVFLVNGKINYERLENILRKMTAHSKSGVVYLLGGLLSVKDLLKNKLESNSLTRAYKFGESKNLSGLLKDLKPKIVINATVVKKKEFKQQGFFGEIIYLNSDNNQKFKIIALNETIFLLDKKNKVLASVPQRILLIEPVKVQGLSCVFLKPKKKVCVAVVNPEKQWQNKKAEKLFGKNRFSFLLKNL